ncbi:MAG: InlB B-repeat-containing protein, partial [Coprobacillaceae bacterium]
TGTMPENGISLYARYTVNEYTATFIKDGTTVGTVDADYGTTFNVPSTVDTTKAGYTFNGWFTAETGGVEWNFTSDTMPVDGITLYTRYTADDQTLHFDITGGLSHTQPEDIIVPTDGIVDISGVANPERDGYRFIGWVDADGNFVTDTFTMPAGGLTVYAVWEDLVETGVWQFEADDVVMTLAEFEEAVDSDSIVDEILSRSNARAWNSETGEDLTPLTVSISEAVETMSVGEYAVNLVYTKKTDEDFRTRVESPVFTKEITLTITDNPSTITPGDTTKPNAGNNTNVDTSDSTDITKTMTLLFISLSIIVLGFTKKKKQNNEG